MKTASAMSVGLLLVLLPATAWSQLPGGAAPERPSILIAPFGASAMTAAVFGYEVAVRMEALLVAGDGNTVISMERLQTMLPPSLAQAIPERRLPAQNSSACVRMRQAAAAAGISLMVCGNVVEVDANIFEVTATVFRSAESRVLEAVTSSDADSVSAKIVAQLPR